MDPSVRRWQRSHGAHVHDDGVLYQRGYDFKFLFDLSSYYEKNRDAYYEALRTVDRTGDYTQWLLYFTGGFASQMFAIKEVAAKHAEGVAAPEPRAAVLVEA